MARRPRRSLAALLIALVLWGCSPGDAAPTTTLAEVITSTLPLTTTAPSVTSTAPAPSTTNPVAIPPSTTIEDIDAEVMVPDGDGPFPAVVLVHGGGWVVGDPSIMRPLASYLNNNGFLTVNIRYPLATLERPAFPGAIDDVACAVRSAAAHPDSDGTVTVVGHSAGAHIGAVVALTGDDYGGDCPVAGSGVPQRFVGLAGPYDISRVGLAVAAFFGAGPDAAGDIWDAGNPQLLADANPGLETLIMYGDLDGLVSDSFAIDFHTALQDSGVASLLERVEGARHRDMHDPDFVGDLIVTWLQR